MSDEVIGTAILQGNELYLCMYSPTYKGGYIHWGSILVTPKSESKLPSPSWQYTKQENRLNVQPSVHQQESEDRGKTMKTTFHNSGIWWVDFIEVSSEVDAFRKLREINNHFLIEKKCKDFFNE